MSRRIPKDAMTRALQAAGADDSAPDAAVADDAAAAEVGAEGPADGAQLSDSADDLPEIPDKLYFRIGEVAGLVGVDAHVLRYWESEFRMKPHRSSSGQRLYRKQDLARFFRVKRLLHDEGYTIAGARRVLAGGTSTAAQEADIPRIREALKRIQDLRGRILEIRDELDPYGRA